MSKAEVNTSPAENQNIGEIFKQYQSKLKGFIAKRVPSKEDAEDILQNVFYQLAKIDLKENPIQQMSSWLYSVTRNQIIDRSRKHKEQELPYYPDDENEIKFMKNISQLLTDEDSSPETDYIKSLVWVELEKALEELPTEQREVFRLAELEGFSFKEISEATGVAVNTLISRKRYAILHLRKRLSEVYNELLKE